MEVIFKIQDFVKGHSFSSRSSGRNLAKGFLTIHFMLAVLLATAQLQRNKSPILSDETKLAQAESFFVEGQKYFMLEDYSKALIFFQRAAELNPNDGGVHYKVAEVLSKDSSGQGLNMAITSIELSLKLDNKNKYYYQLAAKLYASRQNYSKAAAALETMMKEIPGTEEGLYDQAAYQIYAGKNEEALKIYNKIESIFGVNETSSLQKQRILFDAGKVNEAIAEAEKLSKAFPEEPQYALAFAEMLNQNNQQERAIAYLEKFLEANPTNGNGKMLLSVFYKESGKPEKANALMLSVFDDPNVEVGNKILVIGSMNAEIEQARNGNAPNNALEEFAVTLFQKLEAMERDDESVSMAGGDLHFAIKKITEAKYYYRKAIKQGASGFDPWQNLLGMELQAGEYDSLIAHSDEGLELFPNQSALYYFNGLGHMRKNNFKQAVQSFEQAKKLATGNNSMLGDINGLLGDSYNASRQYEKSDQAYEDALALNPNNDFILNNYSYYLSMRKEKLEKAEAMAGKLVKRNPDNATYLDTYGWVLYMAGKYKEARKVMEKVVAQSQANATHFEHYGDILFQLGDVDGAVKQWEKAKGLNTNSDTLHKKIVNRKLN